MRRRRQCPMACRSMAHCKDDDQQPAPNRQQLTASGPVPSLSVKSHRISRPILNWGSGSLFNPILYPLSPVWGRVILSSLIHSFTFEFTKFTLSLPSTDHPVQWISVFFLTFELQPVHQWMPNGKGCQNVLSAHARAMFVSGPPIGCPEICPIWTL